MKNILLIILTIFFFSTVNAQNKLKDLNKIVVVGFANDTEVRTNFERTICEFLGENGLKVYPSINYVNDGENIFQSNKDSLRNIFLNENFDGAIVLRSLGVEKKKTSKPQPTVGEKNRTPGNLDLVIASMTLGNNNINFKVKKMFMELTLIIGEEKIIKEFVVKKPKNKDGFIEKSTNQIIKYLEKTKQITL